MTSPGARPVVTTRSMVSLSAHARSNDTWMRAREINSLDRGLLGILAAMERGRLTPVAGIVAHCVEDEVEIVAGLNRMFRIGLVDVEGCTTRPAHPITVQ